MVLTSTFTSYTYSGGWSSQLGVQWNDVVLRTDDEWRANGGSPLPKHLYADCNFTFVNTGSNDYTFYHNSLEDNNNPYLFEESYWPNPDYRHFFGRLLDPGQVLVVPARQSINVSRTFDITQIAETVLKLDPSIYNFSLHLGFTAMRTYYDNASTLTGKIINFNYQQNVLDKTVVRTGGSLGTTAATLDCDPNTISSFSPSKDNFDNTIKIYFSSTTENPCINPELRIYCEELGGDPLPIIYPDSNRYTFGSGCRQRFAEYFRNEERTTTQMFSFSMQWRNPFKNGELAIGTLIALPNDEVYEVKQNKTDGSYYQPEWQDIAEQVIAPTLTITPDASSMKYFSVGIYSYNITPIVSPQGKDLGCLYSPYTKPTVRISYTAGWGIDKINVNPSGDLWYHTSSFDVNVTCRDGYSSNSGNITITQPDYYNDNFFSPGEITKSCSPSITLSAAYDNTRTVYQYATAYVHKLIPVAYTDFSAYRADSAGNRSVRGDFIGITTTFTGNEMIQQNQKHNAIKAKLTITTLLDQQVVFDDYIDIESGVPWVSKDTYELGTETSYFIELVLSDNFSSTREEENIGTKVTFIEFGNDGAQLAIGKYCESNVGFEVQFPTIFAKQVVILPRGIDKFKEIASVISYDDTYNIGCTNVQQVLDWLNGRLS